MYWSKKGKAELIRTRVSRFLVRLQRFIVNYSRRSHSFFQGNLTRLNKADGTAVCPVRASDLSSDLLPFFRTVLCEDASPRRTIKRRSETVAVGSWQLNVCVCVFKERTSRELHLCTTLH